MKLLIFGATSGTGRQLVEQALAQGHIVTAFVRHPAKFHVSHANLRVAQGDVLRYDTVEPAVTGQDAVLSALGVHPPVFTFIVVTILCQVAARLLALHGIGAWSVSLGIPLLALLFLFRRNTKLSDGTRNIVRAMQERGVKRIVCQSSLGVGDSRGRLGFLYNFFVIPLFLRTEFAAKAPALARAFHPSISASRLPSSPAFPRTPPPNPAHPPRAPVDLFFSSQHRSLITTSHYSAAQMAHVPSLH